MNEEQSERIRLLAEIATELLGMWRDCEHGYICEVSPHIATSLAELTVDAAEYRHRIEEARHGRLAITPAGV